jgi:hypothetical protein
MIINRSKVLLSLVSALVLILSCSLVANAKLSVNMLATNLLATNLLAANSLSDKTKFDLQAVTISKVTLPDGTVLTVR